VAVGWVDRVFEVMAPRAALRRQRARVASELLARHYEGANIGRRTSGWRGTGGDANAAAGASLARLREQARDLVRNNPYASAALDTVVDHCVGWGISGAPVKATPARTQTRATEIWKAWAGTTDCDADGRLDFAGLQQLVMRSVAESGEVFVRRRFRRPEDGLALPIQLQILEADYLDTYRMTRLDTGGAIIHGVEFDPIGRRVAYWLFPRHPGSVLGSIFGPEGFGTLGGNSRPIPASEILHVYKPHRPGQVRGASWFAPVLLRMKDFDEYEDAALMKQKIAACLAVLTSDVDGTSPGLGALDPTNPEVDSLEPGMILNVPPGRAVTVVDPPAVNEHATYSQTVLRGIAAGLGVTYEDMTGDFQQLPFSAARMSRLRHWARVHDWRWQMLIPQFCNPAWAWAMQAAVIMGLPSAPEAAWTAQPMPMIEPDKEGLAYQRNIRSLIMTQSEAIKERGYDPDTFFAEMAEDNKKIDTLGLILDSDARNTTQQGGPRVTQAAKVPPPASAPQPASSNGTGTGRSNGHHPDPLAMLSQVRALVEEIADRVTERMADAAPAPPEVSAPAPVSPSSIHVDVHTEGRERATIIKKTPVRDKDGLIIEVLEERLIAADKDDAVGQGY
jgi:lambda family phage portal protein